MKGKPAQPNLDELKAFLIRANMPHATGTAHMTRESDGSRTIEYSEGKYRMHDNFFGGEPYGGRLVVFFENRVIFIEVYYGSIYQSDRSVDEVYNFLRDALRHPDEHSPYRGPSLYEKAGLTYTNSVVGDISHHTVFLIIQ